MRRNAPACPDLLRCPRKHCSQAEALWKARRFKEANEVFKQLETKEPKNPDYKVRWGRMMMDHAQPDRRGRLSSAKPWRSRRTTPARCSGWRWWPRRTSKRAPADLAKKALESDPKLVEAQELLARLALEDNNNPKATEEAKKALAMDAEFAIGARPFWPPSTGWPTRRKPPGIRTRPKATRPSAISSSLNRRYEEGIAVLPQGHRARPAAVQRALASWAST